MSERVLSISAVKEITSLGRTSIYDGIRKGDFPKPIHLGVRRVAWVASEIDAYLAERIAERAVAP
jgi:prophage regulatory protein